TDRGGGIKANQDGRVSVAVDEQASLRFEQPALPLVVRARGGRGRKGLGSRTRPRARARIPELGQTRGMVFEPGQLVREDVETQPDERVAAHPAWPKAIRSASSLPWVRRSQDTLLGWFMGRASEACPGLRAGRRELLSRRAGRVSALSGRTSSRRSIDGPE